MVAVFCSVYEKSGTYMGVHYLYAKVCNSKGKIIWYHNICLKQYDLALPELQAGDALVFSGELMSEPKTIFVDILLKSLKSVFRNGEVIHHEPFITLHGTI